MSSKTFTGMIGICGPIGGSGGQLWDSSQWQWKKWVLRTHSKMSVARVQELRGTGSRMIERMVHGVGHAMVCGLKGTGGRVVADGSSGGTV